MSSLGSAARSHLGEVAHLAEQVRPRTLAGEQVLAVVPALEGLLPWPGLARGVTVGCEGPGATSLALGLAAAATVAGSWLAVVAAPPGAVQPGSLPPESALPGLGLAAAGQAGVALERLALVDLPVPGPDRLVEVVAALIGAVDLVMVYPAPGVSPGAARRLAARARERGTTLLVCPSEAVPTAPRRPAAARPGSGAVATRWPAGLDVCLTVGSVQWRGLGVGHGHLRARRVRVQATGRRRAARPREAELWLPGPDGRVALVDDEASVTHLPRSGPPPAAGRTGTDPPARRR
jgi:hypothetical protein